LVFDVVTLFPSMFAGPLGDGILARARRSGRVAVRLHDLRRWGVGPRRQVDDAPFGGGGGMVLRPEPLFEAVDWIRRTHPAQGERVVLMSPQGPRIDAGTVRRLAGMERVILLCGRYEGVDERVREALADEELSIADVVLTGGEVPAMVVIDAVARFVPGVLGNPRAAEDDSFTEGVLDCPHYTRPATYRGLEVPAVLLSGDHDAVTRWRRRTAGEATRSKRPDLEDRIGD
jgi:tRNA (guanine37-N1)-methyltransferase